MKTTVRLTESAVMLAASFVLSLIPIIDLPYGGSITLASMLPIMLIAFRHGTVWGLLTGLAGALLQLLMGLDNFSYATSGAAVVAILMLDYLVAFTALGLAGLFRKVSKNQTAVFAVGMVLCCALRYLCHVISGCTVWVGVSIPSADGLVYSLAYNATYMIPETIITVAAGIALSMSLDLTSATPKRAPKTKGKPLTLVLLLCAVVAITVAAVLVFVSMQAASGFDVTLVSSTKWLIAGILAAVAVLCGGAAVATGKN